MENLSKEDLQRQLIEARAEIQRAVQQTTEENAELRRENRILNEQVRQTTLTEFLANCHEHLSESIKAQTDKSQTTQGDPSNATGKKRPDYMQPWKDFIETQKATLEQLFFSYQPYEDDKAFESHHFVQRLGKRMANRRVASELDLHTMIRISVEDSLTAIVNHLQTKVEVRDMFQLPEGFRFDNHLNTLSDYGQQASTQPKAPQSRPSTPPHATPPSYRVQPDQVCVYTTVEKLQKPAMVAEFKPPHKLTIPVLRQVLDPDGPTIELQSLIDLVEIPTNADARFEHKVRSMVAAVLCQAFSYMVACEVQYGYITTGEAFIFLHIKSEESFKKLHYYLAEPSYDVIKQKEEFPDTQFYLHRTALSQLLAFGLLALRSAKENDNWRDNALAGLAKWETDINAMLKQIQETPSPSGKSSISEYKPRAYELKNASLSNRRLRSSKVTCAFGPQLRLGDDEEPPDDIEPPPAKIPTRTQAAVRGKRNQQARSSTDGGSSSHKGQKRSFCTQMCLQGLARGGPLDRNCPNVSDHCGEGYQDSKHRLDCETFRTLLSEQLQRSRYDVCRPLGMQGARGAIFKVTLPSHGYTVVAKGTIMAFVQYLRHEAEVYRRLTSLQGVHIPTFLGNIDLKEPFYYDAAIRIVHLMLLSWSGERLCDSKVFEGMDSQVWRSDLMRGINAMHALGVLHGDIRIPNLLWNEELQRVTIIDFESADIVQDMNRKRKRVYVTKVDGEDEEVYARREYATISLNVASDIVAARTVCA